LLNSETVAFQLDTSEPGYSPKLASSQTQCEEGLGKWPELQLQQCNFIQWDSCE